MTKKAKHIISHRNQEPDANSADLGLQKTPKDISVCRNTNRRQSNLRSRAERGGLGYTEICEYLNKYCGTEIVIPEIEQGYYPKRIERLRNKGVSL